jgi:hypothetical protein
MHEIATVLLPMLLDTQQTNYNVHNLYDK